MELNLVSLLVSKTDVKPLPSPYLYSSALQPTFYEARKIWTRSQETSMSKRWFWKSNRVECHRVICFPDIFAPLHVHTVQPELFINHEL